MMRTFENIRYAPSECVRDALLRRMMQMHLSTIRTDQS